MKRTIQQKATWLVVIVISAMAIAIMTAGLFSVWHMRVDFVRQRQMMDAEIFAGFITDTIDNEVNKIRSCAASLWWQQAVAQANDRYAGWGQDAVRDYMTEQDRRWGSFDRESPLSRELLSSELSRNLAALAGNDPVIAEIFLTDSFGGLVAASGKTSDFFQADEAWWRTAYNEGTGAVAFGEVELDESSHTISSAIAVPIQDERGQTIGVAKVLLNIYRFFEPLIQYRLGKTGHVELYDRSGTRLYCPDSENVLEMENSPEQLRRLLRKGGGISILTDTGSRKKFISAAAEIKSRILTENGISWFTVVSCDWDEFLHPVYVMFAGGFILVVLISVLIIVVTRDFIKVIFIEPVKKILDAAQHFARGDLDYRVRVQTADEFEALGNALNEMGEKLKRSMVSREVLLREIEQRKEAEQIRKESEEKYRLLFEGASDAKMVSEPPEWRFTSVNQAALQMFNVSDRQQFFSLGPWDLSPEFQPDGTPSAEKAKKMIEQAIREGKNFFEWTHRRWRGEPFPASVLLTRVMISGKECVQATVRDITSLKQKDEELRKNLEETEKSRALMLSMLEDNNEIRQQLENSLREVQETQRMLLQAEKLEAIGRLAAGIAHEINTPIQFIGNNVHFLSSGYDRILQLLERIKEECRRNCAHPDKKTVNEFLDTLERSAKLPYLQEEIPKALAQTQEGVDRVARIVNAMKEFSHMGAEKMTPEDINKAIESTVTICRSEWKYVAALQLELDTALPLVRCFIADIKQVVLNLIVNAAHAIADVPEAPERRHMITISTFVRGQNAVITVKDTGTGIPHEVQDKVFDYFFTTKPVGKGTGQGLSMAYASIVEKHKGKLYFETEPGVGTTFIIELPINGSESDSAA